MMTATLPVSGHAQPVARVPVVVVDVAGDVAYVQPGEQKGVVVGTRLLFKAKRYVVEASTSAYAIVRLKKTQLAVGERGVATVRRRRAVKKVVLGTEPPVQHVAGWAEAPRPAESQSPKHVPLTASAARRRYRARLIATTLGSVPLSGAGGGIWNGSIRGIVHAEPIDGFPFSLDADAAVQFYAASNLDERAGANSRPVLVARQLQASVGEVTDFYASLGRLRYAASTVGMLDGVRVGAPLVGGLRLGAFGGAVPRPDDTAPSLDATRFGVELSYDDVSSELRPSASLIAYGSTFGGELDERRIDASAHIYPGGVSLGGFAQLSFYDKDNPWNVATTQLSAAGLDGGYRAGVWHVAARTDFRRPERSKWLASYLPPGYLCVLEPRPVTDPQAPDTCTGQSGARYQVSADTGLTFSRVALTVGGTLSEAPSFGAYQHLVFVQGRITRLAEVFYVESMLSASDSGFVDSYAASTRVGASVISDDLDVSVRYRISMNQWDAEIGATLDHLIGATAWIRVDDTLRLALDGDAMMGPHASAMLFQTSLQWIPL